ncbi:MAG TPA: YcgN family cysteine cluster protein [Gammaproteobacteria bacterium]
MGFWKDTPLGELSPAEWESLCDGCGRCCLVKLEDEESGELCYTAIACGELELESCRCRHYTSRRERVAECITLSAATLADYPWLPSTCAYRLLAAGRPLPAWHPLLSGSSESVHAAGISVRNFAVSQRDLDDDLDMDEFLLDHNP